MMYSFHAVAQSGQEIYQTHKDLLTLLQISNKQLAKFRQAQDPLVTGSLRHGEEMRFFLHDGHWISAKHLR